jgi:hypothetical protein
MTVDNVARVPAADLDAVFGAKVTGGGITGRELIAALQQPAPPLPTAEVKIPERIESMRD